MATKKTTASQMRAARQVPSGSEVLSAAFRAAGERPSPSDPAGKKNAYAVRFADEMASQLAKALEPHFPDITASTKRTAQSVRKKKQLDINFSTPDLGLALGVSLKSVHIREAIGSKGGSGRYTHNMKRNEEELRIEALGYHKRQPYAVMIAVLFLPFDSCNDAGTTATSSSFGSWVRHLRPFSTRVTPRDAEDHLERIYIGLYQPDGSDLAFFDVRTAPPKNSTPAQRGELLGPTGRNGPPLRPLSLQEFVDEVRDIYLERNSANFQWADGTFAPLGNAELEP